MEKKHLNIKNLTAKMNNTDLSKKSTRKWPGLGKNPFIIDYTQMEQYEEFKKKDEAAEENKNEQGEDNEIGREIELLNTVHHKSIVKFRNEFFKKFAERFEKSFWKIQEDYDKLRDDEISFNSYWANNLKELEEKHI